ncbi:MAG: MATE family efflux transporter [Phycisphaerales bacterium]|nr:MATE family efflux transporter [Phycisphaerales bacterium]
MTLDSKSADAVEDAAARVRQRGEAATAVSPDDPMDATIAFSEAERALDGTIRSGKLAGRSMWSAIWLLAIPVLLQQLVAACVGLVDKMIAGSLPGATVVAALDGIGIGSYVAWFIGIALAGLGVGAQAVIARAMGAGNPEEGESACGQSLTFSLLWGALIGAALWFAVVPLAELAGLHGASAEFCIQFVRVLAVAMPATGIMTVGSMCLHGAGETWIPAWIAVAVNIVNVIASWVLSGAQYDAGWVVVPNVLGIDGATWGVYGIAVGTALSYVVGTLLTLRALHRGARDFHPRLRHLRPTAAMMWRVARIGVPNFAEGIALWGVNLFVMIFIGTIARDRIAQGNPGDGLIGAHMIAVQWESFSFLPGFAMGIAAGALAGQYMGAGNVVNARKAINACTIVGCVIMGLLGIAFMTLGEPLTRIISREEIHLREVPPILFTCGTIQVFFALTMVIRDGLRGVGDTAACLGITIVSSYFIRLPLAWALGVWMGYGLLGIWIALCAELVVRGLLFLARLRSGRWEQLRV